MASTSSIDGLKTCPYCGARVPEKAIYCSECKTNLLAEFTGMKRDLANPPPLGATLAAAAALLLLLFLIGMAILDVNELFPYAGYLYLGIITVLLTIVAARGRYGTPGATQYLISFLIVVIPVIGTLYGVYYAGRSLARARGARLALYALLMGMLLVTVFRYKDPGSILAALPLGALQEQATPTPIAAVEATVTPKVEPTSTSRPPTATPLPPTDTPEPVAAVPDCLHWSEVNSEHVGTQACVYGEYTQIYQKEDQAYVMAFSEEAGAFQLWSGPKSMEQYLPQGGGRCVVARGWIMTSGLRPIIILRSTDKLESCDEF
jgi:hypothetical protein